MMVTNTLVIFMHHQNTQPARQAAAKAKFKERKTMLLVFVLRLYGQQAQYLVYRVIKITPSLRHNSTLLVLYFIEFSSSVMLYFYVFSMPRRFHLLTTQSLYYIALYSNSDIQPSQTKTNGITQNTPVDLRTPKIIYMSGNIKVKIQITILFLYQLYVQKIQTE